MNPRWGSVFAALTEPERLPLPSDEQEKDFLVSHPAKQGNAVITGVWNRSQSRDLGS